MSYEKPIEFDTNKKQNPRRSDQQITDRRSMLTSYGSTDKGVNLVKQTITQLPRPQQRQEEQELMQQDW